MTKPIASSATTEPSSRMQVKPRVLFISIATVHIGLIGLMLLQPGCQAPSRTAPVAATAPTRPTTDPTFIANPQSMTATPVASAPSNSALDPAFNANLPIAQPGSGVRQAPTRPSARPPQREPEMLSPLAPTGSDWDNATPAGSTTTTIQRGDTLTAIARREGVSLQALLDANGLTRQSRIFPGDTLIVPADAAISAPAALPDAAGERYTVVSGDSLSRIARRAGISVAALKAANNLRGDGIQVGQVLFVPSTGGAPIANLPSAPPPPVTISANDANSYTVQSGDTLSVIASRFGTTVRALMSANGIDDPRRLRAGQTLTIPGGRNTLPPSVNLPPPARTTTPTPASRPITTPSRPSEPITLNDETSDPVILEGDPFDALEALEEMDLPFVEIENVPLDETTNPEGNGGE